MVAKQPHIIIVTDAWYPHVSGVLRVTEAIAAELDARGRTYTLVHPQKFPTVSVPGYAEVKMAFPFFLGTMMDELIRTHGDVAIHIMTEGALGLSIRNYCLARGLQFTTAFHTHWHVFFKRHAYVPSRVTMHYVREFHKPAARIIVPAQSTRDELEKYHFTNDIVVCPNGVDTNLFRPRAKRSDTKRPHMLFVGRVSKEKSVEEFLELDMPGSKRVVGDGPLRSELEKKYPNVAFSGRLQGEELARAYADADVFVFPSTFDNFSLVLLEALASGVPIAAHYTEGQKILVTHDTLGTLGDDLKRAVESALERGDQEACVAHVREHYSWTRVTDTFLDLLVLAGEPQRVHTAFADHMLAIPRELYRCFTEVGYARGLFLGLGRFVSKK